MRFRRANNRIAVVKVEGAIADGGGVGTDRGKIIDLLKQAERRKARAIVLRVNSPGGTVGACQEIHAAVSRMVDKRIPVVASMGDIAASGGVYISMAATEVIANPGTITGSIGVIIKGNDLSALYEKVGIAPKVVKSGPLKDMLSTYRAFSSEEESILQSLIEDSHAQFVDAVAAGRNRSREEIARIADGRILTGRQAHECGLIDRLGDLDMAVERAADLAKIKGTPRVIPMEARKGLIARILSPFFGGLALAILSLRSPVSSFPTLDSGSKSGDVMDEVARAAVHSPHRAHALPMWVVPWV